MIAPQYGCCVQHNLNKEYKNLIKRIKKNEGFSNKAYLDLLDNPTIGYGHLILSYEKFLLKGSFSKYFLLNLFNDDFNKTVEDYNFFYKKLKIKNEVRDVLIEMTYQMGIKNQLGFKKMNKYIQKKHFFMAALEMKRSLWYDQTPKRVNKLINLFLKSFYEK